MSLLPRLLVAAALAACHSAPPRPAIVAHRGGSLEAPENTMAAIERAIELGADWVEVDVRLSADGVPVLFHDEELDRTTDGSGALAARTLAELRALDAGSWKDARFAGERVPSLEEAVQTCRGRAGLMLDVKVQGGAQAIFAALRAADVDQREVQLGVWDDHQIADALPHRGSVVMTFIGEAPANVDGKWVGFVGYLGCRALSVDHETVTDRLVRAAEMRDMPLYVWTVNEAGRMRELLDMGVSGIVTDDPATLAAVLDEHPRGGGRR